MMTKDEAIAFYREEVKPLYVLSADRIVEDAGINDKDYLWFLYNDFADMKKRMHGLMNECSKYPDYRELDHTENESTLTWDMSYTDQRTGVQVRFVFLGEKVE